MKLKEIKLKNFKSHSDFSIKFTEGLTGLFGANGSGKSSLISAVNYVLTGVVIGGDKKEDVLKWGTTKGKVTLLFEHETKEYILERSLHNAKTSLKTTDGGISMTTRSVVQKYIHDITGVHPDLYDKVICVAQEELDTPLKATHAVSQDFYLNIFNCKVADTLSKALSKCIAKVAICNTHKAEISAKTIQKEELELEIIALEKRLALLKQTLEQAPAKDKIQANIEKLEKALGEGNLLTNLKDKMSRLKAQEEKLKEFLKGKEKPLVEAIRPSEWGIEQQYNIWQNKKAYVASMKTEVKPAVKDKCIPKGDLKTIADKVNNDYMLYKFKQQGAVTSECPVCSNKIKDKTDYTDKLESTKQIGMAISKYRKEEVRLQGVQSTIEKIQKDLEKMEAALPNEVIIFNPTNWKERVKDNEILDSIVKQEQQLAQVVNELEKTEDDIQKLSGGATDLKTIKKQLSEQKKALNAIEGISLNIYEKQVELNNKCGIVSASNELIKEWKEADKLAVMYNNVREKLQICKDYLHRDQLPKLVIQRGLASINECLNKYLNIVEIPYNCYINNDCDLVFEVEGEEKAFRSLSGGQRKTVALAFRLAVSEIMTPDLGLLILDEPTAYVDSQNIDNMINAIKKLKEYAQERGLILWVATHEEKFKQACTKYIEL